MSVNKVESENKHEVISSYLMSLQNDDAGNVINNSKSRLQHELEIGLNDLQELEMDTKSKSIFALEHLKFPVSAVLILLFGWFLLNQLDTQNDSNHEILNAIDVNNTEAELISNEMLIPNSETQSIKSLTTILDVMFLPDDNNAINSSKSLIGANASFTKAYSIIKKVIRSNDLRIEEGLPGYIVTGWYYQNAGNNTFIKSRLIAKSESTNENKIVFYVEKTEVQVEDIKDNKIYDEQIYSAVIHEIKSDFHSVGL
ncbi:MAG: hypothetical protein KGZ71_12685 [Desulfobulbaceae bacterium]|nr:hypothetical protein [Candidatus Kapabacteria bacterium]MBS4000705.1 hypothetical protein [Desulfobulbaceae bacterium]MBS4001328.1 hypothetical protein [Desulfobulbaceae bacterium]